MKPSKFVAAFALAAGIAARAQAPLPAEVKVPNETIPAGGTVQMKFQLTEPRPIMVGGGHSVLGAPVDALFGVSAWSPLGDAFGVAGYLGGSFTAKVLSPLGSYGTNVDYPVLTVTAHISANALPGAQMPVAIDGGYTDPLGNYVSYIQNAPGIVTVGGALSIHNIVPGGGTWPGGTTVKILGTGFNANTKIRVGFRTKSIKVANSGEIDVVLDRDTPLDGEKFIVTNPDKTSVTYFAYLRGVEQTPSTKPVIAHAEPIFPLLTAIRARVSQASRGFNNTIDTALSIQNPNPRTADVILTAITGPAATISAKFSLESGEKITRELGEFFGTNLTPGTRVIATASLPLQFVPFTADSASGDLTPFVPAP